MPTTTEKNGSAPESALPASAPKPALAESAPAESAPAIDITELIAPPEKREPAFRIPAGARSLAFGDYSLSAGVSTRGASKGTPHLVLSLGAQQNGFPLAAVATAIMEGLIDRQTIAALWAAADARESK